MLIPLLLRVVTDASVAATGAGRRLEFDIPHDTAVGRPAKNAGLVNRLTFFLLHPCLVYRGERLSGATEMTSFHGEVGIESFEAGRSWHARIWRASYELLVIGGVAFPHVEGGFAWPDRTAATDDAETRIDRFGARVARHDTSGIQLTTVA